MRTAYSYEILQSWFIIRKISSIRRFAIPPQKKSLTEIEIIYMYFSNEFALTCNFVKRLFYEPVREFYEKSS